MNKYESIIIVNSNLNEEEIKKVETSITDLIKENGILEKVENWGKKKLAYPVKKHQYGIYMDFKFESKPEFAEELERKYNITEEIIKNIIVKRG